MGAHDLETLSWTVTFIAVSVCVCVCVCAEPRFPRALPREHSREHFWRFLCVGSLAGRPTLKAGNLIDATRCNALYHENRQEFLWCNSSGLAGPEL